ncbi:DUF2357 domain-containing protein [Methanobrevibacter millerae]|uniref:DUF2357 domain-containing protein n=1 Tax=Methanobrevibacter millerae TaxID=230361 RepID=A0A1G5WGW0_9EURY|nr:DUF2357 domain-containing protein [Methanobrevibacter millerae]SDA57378.1 hypothetical protein SAMN02910315_01407 [Methanobrevibacter millerae]
MTQIVKIKAYDKDSFIGTFVIKCESDYCDGLFEEMDNITLENVPVVYENSSKMPIIYNKTNEFADLCLIEEILYEISFESEMAGIEAFSTLQRFEDNSPLTLTEFKNCYKGYLQFSSYVGKTFLDITKDGKCIFRYPIEIRSRKLDYDTHYPIMIGDLSKYASGVIFELTSPIYQEFKLTQSENQSPYEKFMILEYILRPEHLPSIIEYLSRNLYSTLENRENEVPISVASNINPNELLNAYIDSENLYKFQDIHIPDRINETNYVDTIDVAENRFYKYFLELIEDLIDELLLKIEEGYVHDKLKNYKNELNYYISQKYFEDISRLDHIPLNSQVLQKKEGYRDILLYYLMLEFGFKLNWNTLTNKFKGHEKKVFELYEYWCYFELIQIMESICESKVKFKDIFEPGEDMVSINLKEGIMNSFIYKDMKIDLLYNKSFNRGNKNYNSYSVTLRPDYTISVHKNDKKYFIHFDAKYKMYIDSESFKNEDIVKMHAYKDALKNTIGSYILYPGTKNRIFYEDESESTSVGAFGLTPGENNEDKIASFIIEQINKI